MRYSIRLRLAFVAVFAMSFRLPGQVLDLTVRDVGIAIGDKPTMTGLRINYRDRDLRQVNGVNLTLWSPYEPATGTVNGFALGLPATGARIVNGVAAGVVGVGAEKEITGLGVAGIGVASGGALRGVM